MNDDLNPSEVAIVKQRRIKFVSTLFFAFLIATIAAWWVVPTYAARITEIKTSTSFELPLMATSFIKFATLFRYFWFTLAAASIILGALGHFGALDSFLPVLNACLFILAALLILVCFTAVFMPTIAMAQAVP